MNKLFVGSGRKRRWYFALLIVFAFSVIIAAFQRDRILTSLASWLDVGERPRAVDFVMVLPGGPESRPFVAAAMMHAGLATGILTPETETDPANDEGLFPSTDFVMRKTLLLRGIREDQIQVLPGRSNSTWTDALALAGFLRRNPEVTVAIVTDDYHTRRSRWVFQKVLRDDARRIYFISAKFDTVAADSWWTTEEGLRTYLGEYSKLLIYVVTEGGLIMIVLEIALPTVIVWQLIRRNTRLKRSIKPASP